jgi:hypothetical protein
MNVSDQGLTAPDSVQYWRSIASVVLQRFNFVKEVIKMQITRTINRHMA